MRNYSESEFRSVLDNFIEAMRNDDERSLGFRELDAYLRFHVGQDGMTVEYEATIFKHFGDHYDLKRWPIGRARWSFIEG